METPSPFVQFRRDDDRTVSETMTRAVVTIGADRAVGDAAALMKRHNIGCVPVEKAGTLVGILTDRDVAVRVSAEGLDCKLTRVWEAMTPQISFVSPHWRLEDAARFMSKLKVHRLAVLDGNMRLVGILSWDDLPGDLRGL